MTDTNYSFSFTSAGLRPDESRILAEIYVAVGDWSAAREETLSSNAFRSRTDSSLKRLEMELRQRLALLTDPQIELIGSGTSDERIALCWLAALRRYRYIWEFTTEVLANKFEERDLHLRPSDYQSFCQSKGAHSAKILSLSEESHVMVRSRIHSMLRDAGILIQNGRRQYTINRPLVPSRVVTLISQDDPRLLAGFLWTPQEIKNLGSKR